MPFQTACIIPSTMNRHTLTLQQRTLSVYPAMTPKAPLVLTFLPPQQADALASLIHEQVTLIAIDEAHWEQALTPWPAAAVFKNTPDFGGGAEDYLHWLTQTVLPQVKTDFQLQPSWQGLIGYSLGGLFAAYAAYRTTVFSRIASVSGSLWFDHWQAFIRQHLLSSLPYKAYFSVGEREKYTRNPRLATVEQATVLTHRLWQQQGVNAILEYCPGGHFQDMVPRMAQAARCLWLDS